MDKDIIEGNKLIALFIGAKYIHKYGFADQMGYEFDIKPYAKEQSIRTWHREDSLEFHSSWDWLMPVVEKIGEICKEREEAATNKDEWAIDGWKTWSEQVCRFNGNLTRVKIESTWKAVVKFIKWYNSNQSNQREVQ